MTRNNNCCFKVDVGEKEFKRVVLGGTELAYTRFYGFVKGTKGANKVQGVRFIAYGPLAELIYAHIQTGSQVFIISHLQIRRDDEKRIYNEFVVEEIEYLRSINWDKGKMKMLELVEAGQLRPGKDYFDEETTNNIEDRGEE